MIAEVRRLFPKDEAGYRRFLKDSEERYQFGFEGLGRRPMNKLMDLSGRSPASSGCAPTAPSMATPRPASATRACAWR
jgi:phytoene dehydrogenase-like protein